MASASRLSTVGCHAAVCLISQNLEASTPTTQAKLILMSAVAATCGTVDSIVYFTVKE
jgi:hypothetical protein